MRKMRLLPVIRHPLKKAGIAFGILILSGCVLESLNETFNARDVPFMKMSGVCSGPGCTVFIKARNFEQPDPLAVDAWVFVATARGSSISAGPALRFWRTTIDLSDCGGLSVAEGLEAGTCKYWRRRFVSDNKRQGLCSIHRSWIKVLKFVRGDFVEETKLEAAEFQVANYTTDVCTLNNSLSDSLSDEVCPPGPTDIHNFLATRFEDLICTPQEPI